MIIVVITFMSDEASVNERNFLIKNFEKFEEIVFDDYGVFKLSKLFPSKNEIYLLTTDRKAVFYENIDVSILEQTNIKPDLIIFATKHQSKSGIHSLSIHTQGNWNSADYGGKKREVGICPVAFLNKGYLKLKEVNERENLGYEVILECTHHGPYLETPSAFIEIGSDLESWTRKDAGKAISETLLEILPNFKFELENPSLPIALGIGGLHHCPQFTKRIERNEAYISHVMPKYIDSISLDSLEKAILNSIPKINLILFDWKGLGKNKAEIVTITNKLAEKFDLEIKRTSHF